MKKGNSHFHYFQNFLGFYWHIQKFRKSMKEPMFLCLCTFSDIFITVLELSEDGQVFPCQKNYENVWMNGTCSYCFITFHNRKLRMTRPVPVHVPTALHSSWCNVNQVWWKIRKVCIGLSDLGEPNAWGSRFSGPSNGKKKYLHWGSWRNAWVSRQMCACDLTALSALYIIMVDIYNSGIVAKSMQTQLISYKFTVFL